MACAALTTLAGLRASRTLHRLFVRALLRAEPRFHDTTALGRTLNRASDDMATVDLVVPFTVRSALNCVLAGVTALGVVSRATPIFLVSLVPLGVLYYLIQVGRQEGRTREFVSQPVF